MLFIKHMKRILLGVGLFLCAGLPSFSATSYRLSGDWGFSDLSESSPGSGLWQVDLKLTAGRHEFSVEGPGLSWPDRGNPSWLTTDSGGNVRVTYDANTHLDGWACPTGRIGVSVDPGAWTLLGSFPGGSASMTPLGNGLYVYQQSMAPGTWDFAIARTGSPGNSDNIGSESRETYAQWMNFTTTSANPLANVYLDALNGTLRVDVTPVPEPTPLGLVACAAGIWLVWLRRLKPLN